MILSTHYVVGMAIASQTGSPLLMPALALLSHFLMDKIPHWEYLETANEIKKKFYLIAIDLLFPFIASVLLFYRGSFDLQTLIWLNLGGFLAILPDGLVFLKLVGWLKNPLIKRFFKFHEKNHTLKKISFSWGLPAQTAIILIGWGIVMS